MCVCVWACAQVREGMCGGWLRVLDPLELKLLTVVCCHKWVLGTEHESSVRTIHALNCGAISLIPITLRFMDSILEKVESILLIID